VAVTRANLRKRLDDGEVFVASGILDMIAAVFVWCFGADGSSQA
jgi:hypothetical protein